VHCAATIVPAKELIPSILPSQSLQSVSAADRSNSGGETMHQFTVGEVVTCIPDMFLRHAAPGDYKIVGWMPDRDGDHMYRIKSPFEEHERVVKESLLLKSEGHLPQEEFPEKRPRRRSITLSTRVKPYAVLNGS
jgi:hypothetical protein